MPLIICELLHILIIYSLSILMILFSIMITTNYPWLICFSRIDDLTLGESTLWRFDPNWVFWTTILSGHPLFNGHLLRSPILSLMYTVNLTSVKRSPLLSRRAHLIYIPICKFVLYFTFIKRSPGLQVKDN